MPRARDLSCSLSCTARSKAALLADGTVEDNLIAVTEHAPSKRAAPNAD